MKKKKRYCIWKGYFGDKGIVYISYWKALWLNIVTAADGGGYRITTVYPDGTALDWGDKKTEKFDFKKELKRKGIEE